MRAVGRLGQAAARTCARCCARPRTAGRSPAGRGPGSDESADLAAVQPGPGLISSSGRIRPSPFSRAVTVVRASSRESATSCWVNPRAHPAPSPICSRKGYAQSFRRPRGRFAAAIANTSGWGRPRTAGGPQRRGRAVNQRRRSGTCRYRTPHTPPEARGGRFSWSRAPRPETESSPGTSGSRFRQRPKVCPKVWTWSVAPLAGVDPVMTGPIAAVPNVMSFNCSTQGSGRPAGRRHPKAIAFSVSLWCGDNPTLVVHALAVSQFVPTRWLVLRADLFLNLVGRPHTPQANATPRSTADSARGPDTRPTMALIPAGAPHADINGRSPGTERLHSQWLGGRRKSRLAWAWTTRVEATIPKVESSARY